jgi:hypothetical protein
MVLGIDYSYVSPSSCYPHGYGARLRGVHFRLPLVTCTVGNTIGPRLWITNPAAAEPEVFIYFK